MKKQFIVLILVLTSVFIFSGCSNTKPDDKGSMVKEATKNFDYIVSNNIEDKVFHSQLDHFGLLLKDGDKFEWTGDTSVSKADYSLSLNADEFIKAGLDVSKLDGTSFTYQKPSGTTPGMLVYTFNVSDKKAAYKDYKEAFEVLLSQIPERLSRLNNDGFILDIGQVFQVHWNGEQRKNKDIAFVINAKDLIKAGLDVNKIKVWKIRKNTDASDTQIRLFKVYYLK